MADDMERTDDEKVEDKEIDDLEVPSEQADDVSGGRGVLPGRE